VGSRFRIEDLRRYGAQSMGHGAKSKWQKAQGARHKARIVENWNNGSLLPLTSLAVSC
jgi:hypothetical protein